MSTENHSHEATEPTILPDVWTLLQEAFGAYRENLRAVLGVGALGLLLTVTTQAALFFALFSGFTSLFAGNTEDTAALAIGVGVFLLLEWWLGAVLMVGIAHAIKGASFKEALRAGVRQAFSYVWFTVLANGLFFGYTAVAIALPTIIIWALFAFGFGASGAGSLIAAVYAIVAFFVLLAFFVGWYATAVWVLIDGEARGARAFILSARRCKPQLTAVATRVLLGGALLMVGYMALAFVGDMISALFGKVGALFAQSAVSGALSYLLFLPLVLALVYAVHQRVRANAPAETVQMVSRKAYWGTLALAWLGMLFSMVALVGLLGYGLYSIGLGGGGAVGVPSTAFPAPSIATPPAA